MTDDELFAQASAWHFRLQAEDASDEDRLGFEAWLAQGDAQAHAWDEAQLLLAALQPAARRMQPQAPPRRRRTLPWAAAALLLLALGVVWQTPWSDRLRADHYTAVGESEVIELADGSRIELNTDAAVRVELTDNERRVHLLRGEAWFEVAHNANRPFVVQSGHTRVRVLGTRFSVSRLGEHTRVQLAEGRVETMVEGSGKAILAPGEAVEAAPGYLSAVQTFEPAAAFAWRQRQLVFRQQPLGEVVAELNRYWPGYVLISDSTLERKAVSGVFEIDKPEAVLRALQLTLGLRVDRYSPYLTLLREAAPQP
ncbi:MAG: FecR family protein [Pseudomonas sp.]|uniref:FecR family protein n=1 Tax=Pseudomonas sp. TaxID=306 RepID=UPI00398277FD